jgi:MFS family permease
MIVKNNILYYCRFLEGVGSAGVGSSLQTILMVLFPGRNARITSFCETCIGLGYIIGKCSGVLVIIKDGLS